MGYTRQRASGFAAYYRDRQGRRRSAGIFPSKREAQLAADQAEMGILPATPTRKNQTLRRYIEDWLQSEQRLLPNTLRSYEHAFRRDVLPILGDLPVSEITRRDVEGMIITLRNRGSSPHVVHRAKAALGSALKRLVPEVLSSNPTHGVRVTVPPARDFNLLDGEEVKRIMDALPTDGARLFANFLVSTGLRFGEATEIRRKDLNLKTQEVSVTRRANDIGSSRANGSRFIVLHGTKAGVSRGRTVGLPDSLTRDLREWILTHALREDDLIFPRSLVQPRENAMRRTNVTDHLPNDAWNGIWREAVKKADLGWSPRVYDLRHAFATHLVASGVSIYEVKKLMGHQQIDTTLRYLHRVEAQQSKAREVMEEFLH